MRNLSWYVDKATELPVTQPEAAQVYALLALVQVVRNVDQHLAELVVLAKEAEGRVLANANQAT